MSHSHPRLGAQVDSLRQRLADAEGEAHATQQELMELRDWRRTSETDSANAQTTIQTTLMVIVRELMSVEAQMVAFQLRVHDLTEAPADSWRARHSAPKRRAVLRTN